MPIDPATLREGDLIYSLASQRTYRIRTDATAQGYVVAQWIADAWERVPDDGDAIPNTQRRPMARAVEAMIQSMPSHRAGVARHDCDVYGIGVCLAFAEYLYPEPGEANCATLPK